MREPAVTPCWLAELSVLYPAFLMAQAAQPEGPSAAMQILPIVAIFALFYFLMMRPAQRERQAREELLTGLKKNDRVVTQGGLLGVVTAIRTEEGIVTLRSHDDTKIDVVRSSIVRILKDEPAEKPETNT